MGSSESKANPSPPDEDGMVITKFNVGMTCSGCSGAVTRILSKIEGVEEVQCDVDKKTVFVKSEGDKKDVCLEKLMKWSESSGKSVECPETQ